VIVNACSTGLRLGSGVDSTVLITQTSYSFTLTVQGSVGSSSWTAPGTGTFSFAASASGYVTKTISTSITSSTTSVTICLEPAIISVDVRDIKTNKPITVSALVSWTGVSSGSFTWTTLYSWTHSGYGSYTFVATPSSTWSKSNNTVVQVSSSTTLIIIYVSVSLYCGDTICSPEIGENAASCNKDCVGIFMEFENADGSGPVNGLTVNYYPSDPRTANADLGPVRNSVTSTNFRTTGNASNTVYQDTYSYKNLVYVESVMTNFINFYWTADVTVIDPNLGTWRLRVHLSTAFTSASYTYRFVNSWRPTDAEPAPYAPTDLNLHVFHPDGALDINNPTLISSGLQIGKAVADSKQSGGPATMDISSGANAMVAVWNSKPPRNAVLAPSQKGRYLVDSGSYVVVYGKTSDKASGKQLGQSVIKQVVDHVSDLWYVMQFTALKPAQNQPTISPQTELKASTIDASQNMFFDCEAYSYCKNFEVPYSDTGRF